MKLTSHLLVVGPFKVGDTVYFQSRDGNVTTGTVVQIEGGKDRDLTEVHWFDLPPGPQVLWLPTNQLLAKKPT